MSQAGNSGGFSIGPAKGAFGIELRELWDYRYLFWRMLVRPIQVRYKQSLLGISWAVIRPLATMAVFTIFFGTFLDVKRHVGSPYPLFVLAGLLPWSLAAATVTGAASSTVNNAHLIGKVYFPRLFMPLSVIGWTGLDFLVGMVVLGGLLVGYGVAPGISVLLLPIVLVLIVSCAMGIGVFLSALNIRYRDFAQVMPFLVQIWLFLTPVIYPSKVVPSRYRLLTEMNPMTGLITAFRSCILGTPVNWSSLGISTSICLLLLLLGTWYFSRVEDFFADVV